ncbi:MAG: pyridoxal-phosphate dependent enzyme [Immundisolibacterales bacterium]|nr:pyridoxal-phosphate dependent enzyme [Immundisolibacterales bacterium]
MLRGDCERTERRVRTVHLQACDTDEVSALGGDDERVEHGGVQVFHRQPGCGGQPGDGNEFLAPRRSWFKRGQGTIGLELLEDLGSVDTLIAGLSGGRLLWGTAIALKAANPELRVIGVSMERGPAMIESIRAGRPVPMTEEPSLANSLGSGIGMDNRHTFELMRRVVNDYVLVSERETAVGMAHLFRHERLIAEGGASVGVAAMLAGRLSGLHGNVACIISGNNVDMDAYLRVINGSSFEEDGD